MNTDRINNFKEHDAPDLESMDRASLLKEAFKLITTLTDEQLTTVLERMGYNVQNQHHC